ncbi:MAG: MotA/TolQ/ExbB proton channel family protein [Acidobacteriota bacterium]|nr:MotA/TolQ/ExbB proton channel family protein [Acidobacteriota bacterium]
MVDWIKEVYSKDPLTVFSLAFITLVFLLSVILLLIPLWIRTRQIQKLRKQCVKQQPADASLAGSARASILKTLTSYRWMKPFALEFDRRWRGAFLEEYAAALGEFRLSDSMDPINILPRVANRQLAGVIPGILVALGILGTFMGLVLGLPELKTNVQAYDTAELSRLIANITKSLSLAFWTSICGISYSILFLFFDRMLMQRVENEVEQLSNAVANSYRTLSADEMGRIQFNLIKNGVDTLRHLGADLASNLANIITPAFGEAVKAELAPTMQEVSVTLGKLADLMGKTQMESLKAVVEGAVGSMNSAMGEHLQNLAGTIETTVAAQHEMNTALSAFRKQMDDSAIRQIELTQTTLKAADTLGTSLDKLERIANSLGIAADQIAAAARSAETSAAAAVESHRTALQAQKELNDAVEKQTDSLRAAREDLVSAWNATVEQARSAIYQIQEATRELGEGIGESLVKTLETFDGAAARIVGHFSGTLSQLDASIGELPPIVDAIKEAGQQILSSSNTSASELSKLESIVSGPFTSAARDAVEASIRTTEAVESIRRLINAATEVSNQLTGTSQKLAAAANSFIYVKIQIGQLPTTLGQIQPRIPAMEQQLQTLTASLDGPLTSQLSVLTEVWKSIEPALNQLGSLPDRMVSVRASLDAVQSGVTTHLSELNRHMNSIRTRLYEKTESSDAKTAKPGVLGGLFGRK